MCLVEHGQKGMGVFNMDQNNQLAANANFCGTNNSSRVGGGFDQFNSARNQTANNGSAGGSGNGQSGVFTGFFTGFNSNSSAVGGGNSMAGTAANNGAAAAMSGLGQAMRDLNVWMPQSM